MADCYVKHPLSRSLFNRRQAIAAGSLEPSSIFILSSLIFLLSTSLPVSLWTIRNYLVYQDFILVNSAGGLALYFGNNPYATGRSNPNWEINVPVELPGLNVNESSKVYFKRGLDFIWANPGKAFIICFHKAYYLWEPLYYQIPLKLNSLYQLGLNNHWLWSYIFLLLGLIITATRKDDKLKERYLLISLIIVFTLGHMIFKGEPRYRVPILPFVYLFQAVALTWIFPGFRLKDSAKGT